MPPYEPRLSPADFEANLAVTLSAGSRLGPYEILGQIGAGGMGEVYRAKDPRLNREVAIKVLPSSFSTDADRLRRFEQEAKAAGVLNHPNITAVYDIGTYEGAPYVVQELLEGETLRAALASGGLSPRRAIDYAIQIAHGLAAAHEKGIVHRDLKPENLFVGKDDRVKILDFGLAKLLQAEGDASGATSLPTETRGTEPGLVLGTLGYMAPEQVRGKPADGRSDIFSFGAILFEMLSGHRAFRGDSAADTMSAILKEDPADLSVTSQAVSPGLERVVRHCLEKSPERRFQSARDLAFNLEALSSASAATSALGSIPAVHASRRWPLVAAGALAIAALGVLAGRQLGQRAARGAAPMTYQQLTASAGHKNTPALSPDGKTFSYARFSESGGEDIWTQRVGGQTATNLTKDCSGDDNFGVFSPDGGLVAYRSNCGGGGIFLVGATGENGRRLTNFGFNPAWFPDGRRVAFSTNLSWNGPERSSGRAELWTVELSSGKTTKLYDGDAVQPSVSPHGLRIAFWGVPEGGSQRDIWTVPVEGLKTGEKAVPATQDAAIDWNPIWSADGRSIYFLSDRNGTFNLWRIAVDEASGRARGVPEPVTLPARAVMQFRLSQDGRAIVYMAREWAFHLERFALQPGRSDTAGGEEIWSGTMPASQLAVSHDGQWLAFGSPGKQEDLYLMRSDGAGLRKLTDDAWRDRHPSFSPDARTLAFRSDRNGRWELWTIAADGSELTQLTRTTGESPADPLWSPDGRFLAFARGRDVQMLPMDGAHASGGIESIPPPGPDLSFRPLAWSPDHTRLLGFTARDKGSPQTEGVAYVLASKSYEKLAVGGDTSDLYAFSDGHRFAVSTGPRHGISMLDATSGQSQMLLAPARARFIQSWAISPDGKFLFVNRATEQSDIWLATPESE